jgi:hypothetical protein
VNQKTKIDPIPLRDGASRLLRSQHFFGHFLEAAQRAGLVGEQENALVVFVVGVSRLLAHPVNLFIKGASSSGKNFLAKTVLRFFPADSVVEISSSSDTSWNYQATNLEHRVVCIQEQNQATGNIHPARLLISENQLVRMVTVRSGSGFTTKKEVTKGPVACLSTTTRDRLQIDDETRHLSIWVDDSPEQTKKIVQAQLHPGGKISEGEFSIWHEVQHLLAERAKFPIEFGDWSRHLGDQVWAGDVRVRRYFEAFMEVCKTICLIRSFQFSEAQLMDRGKLSVDFTDFAVAAAIFDSSLSQSLSYGDDEDWQIRKSLADISHEKGGAAVDALDLAQKLGISKDRAYARLRAAAKRGTVNRVNAASRGNKKLFLPSERVRMIPEASALFEKLMPGERQRFVHPVTGEMVEYGYEDSE